MGYAFGFMLAGEWISLSLFGEDMSWRFVYFFESAVMLFFVLFFSANKSSSFQNNGKPFRFSEAHDDPSVNHISLGLNNSRPSFLQQVFRIVGNSRFMLLVLGKS